MKRRGADVLARGLAAAGVRHVFALSGNHVMPVFDAALDAGLNIIHVRHEAAAVHMADAWARLTGEVGAGVDPEGTRLREAATREQGGSERADDTMDHAPLNGSARHHLSALRLRGRSGAAGPSTSAARASSRLLTTSARRWPRARASS